MSDNINGSEDQYTVAGKEDSQAAETSSLFAISDLTITCPSDSLMEEKMGKCEEKLKQMEKMLHSFRSSLTDIRRNFEQKLCKKSIQEAVQSTIEQLSSGGKKIGIHDPNEQEKMEHTKNEIEQLQKSMADIQTDIENLKTSSSKHGSDETTQQQGNTSIQDLLVEIAALKSKNEELMEANITLERQIKELKKRHEDDSSEMNERILALEQATLENARIDRHWNGNEDQITEESIQHENEQREGSRSPENKSFFSRLLPNLPWSGNQS